MRLVLRMADRGGPDSDLALTSAGPARPRPAAHRRALTAPTVECSQSPVVSDIGAQFGDVRELVWCGCGRAAPRPQYLACAWSATAPPAASAMPAGVRTRRHGACAGRAGGARSPALFPPSAPALVTDLVYARACARRQRFRLSIEPPGTHRRYPMVPSPGSRPSGHRLAPPKSAQCAGLRRPVSTPCRPQSRPGATRPSAGCLRRASKNCARCMVGPCRAPGRAGRGRAACPESRHHPPPGEPARS